MTDLGRVVLVAGGAASGKTAFALHRALELGERPAYLATAQAGDDEMSAKIAAHRRERGRAFQTYEEPLDLVSVLRRESTHDAWVVDDTGLWLANLMHAERDVAEETRRLVDALGTLATPVVLVSPEVGLGLVPSSPLGRRFRDAQGRLNQALARHADEVHLAVAGLVLRLKPTPVQSAAVPIVPVPAAVPSA